MDKRQFGVRAQGYAACKASPTNCAALMDRPSGLAWAYFWNASIACLTVMALGQKLASELGDKGPPGSDKGASVSATPAIYSAQEGLSVLHSASSRPPVKKAPAPGCATAGSSIQPQSAKALQGMISLFTRTFSTSTRVDVPNPSLSPQLCQGDSGGQVNMSSKVLDIWEATLNTATLARKLSAAWVICTNSVAGSTLGTATIPCMLAKGALGS